MKVRTLHPKLVPLMQSAPLLTASMEVANEVRAMSRMPVSHIKERTARQLTSLIAEVAEFREVPETDIPFRGDNTRYTMEVIVMTPAELAVLLTRAFEAGTQS